MSTTHTHAKSAATGEPADACGACQGPSCAVPAPPGAAAPAGWTRFRVPTMDCASEESEIRRAVQHIADIRAMSFQLGQRTVAIDAPLASVEQAVIAIRKAGFDLQPVQD
ncbi:MAG: cation transporter, partial [Zoogloea sp.]|nr:cation transporter [Zoogloea sp.]